MKAAQVGEVPVLLTSAMALSLEEKTVRRVTSRTLPSLKRPSTASCCQRAGWLSRRLAWETTLDHLIRNWEEEQGVRPYTSAPGPRRPRRPAVLRRRGEQPRRLCHTDGAGLPLALSDLVAALTDRGLIDATVTCGQAFGGDYEAVSVHSALAIARHVAGADAVVLCLPATRETAGVIGRAELALLPRWAMIVNIGRGALIDQPALVEALAGGRIAGAGLDVFATEPLPADDPLWRLENVVLSPHVGGRGGRTLEHQVDLVADNVERFAAGLKIGRRGPRRAGPWRPAAPERDRALPGDAVQAVAGDVRQLLERPVRHRADPGRPRLRALELGSGDRALAR